MLHNISTTFQTDMHNNKTVHDSAHLQGNSKRFQHVCLDFRASIFSEPHRWCNG